MKISSLRISARLKLGFGAMALLMIVTLAMTWALLQQLSGLNREVSQRWLPAIAHVSKFEGLFLNFRSAETRHVLQSDKAAKDQAKTELAKLQASIDQALAFKGGDAETATESPAENQAESDADRALQNALGNAWAAYLKVHTEVIQKSEQWATEEAMAKLEGDSRKALDGTMAALQALAEATAGHAQAAGHAADNASNKARLVIVGLGLAALAMATIMALSLIRSVTKPLNEALAAAERIAKGDLAHPIASSANDETGLLLQSLARMQSSLVQSVGDVRAHAQDVATASVQIAQGNSTLSLRTEQQAAALQQTNATMSELGSTVRNNADSAQRANELAHTASSIAQRGGEVVGQVVSTMGGINNSSRRIAEIISTIDGIAFQTNILALNAAVEAARAGEQGRGFAVVASEVRSLAQRSAAAAKEISQLISASVSQVGQGTELVDRAGQTMQELLASVRQVATIVGEISAASAEQSQGVSQMGQAMAQMDEAVQQNAALVEQSAAAAESLKAQASALVSAVSQFEIDAPQHAHA